MADLTLHLVAIAIGSVALVVILHAYVDWSVQRDQRRRKARVRQALTTPSGHQISQDPGSDAGHNSGGSR